MAIIKRKNKKFDYKPRYYKGEGNPYAIKHKFDEFRSSTVSDSSLKGKINGAISDLKGEQNILKIDDETYQLEETNSNKVVLYIIAILVLIFLFIIDFDLSIFSRK
ncbi:riboflavin synthase subunit beta [Flavobacteriaceae bacterium]|nr:riboflavin synthase subunit beta [Flavobacteriaceae bacterium]